MAFSLNLSNVTGEDIGAAAFHALVGAAWVMFEALQIIWLSQQPEHALPPLDLRERWVRQAFDLVGGRLPFDNPYTKELRRYLEEEALVVLRNHTPPPTIN